MGDLKKGLANYRTTVTGILTILFGALGQSFPDYSEVFNSLAAVSGMAFSIFVKDAATGSSPGKG